MMMLLKFMYSAKATKFCKISTVDLSYVVPVKSKVKILQNFVAYSEYMNFKVQLFFEGHKYVHNHPYAFEIYLVNVNTMSMIA